MRLNATNYRRAKAIATIRGWPLRRVIETATREFYEKSITDEERRAVDVVVEVQASGALRESAEEHED